jgi:signal transduction histidine kinase
MLNIYIPNKNPDPELKRKASILIKIIWSVIVIITLSFVVNMFIQSENIFRYSVILLLVWTVSATLLFFTKKGYIYFSAFAYVSFLLLMIFAFSWTGGGIKGHGIKILPIVVLFAGLTLGRKEIWLFGIIATLGGLVLTLADYFHQLPVKEALGQSPLIYWIYNTTAILMLCFFENLSVEELRKALDKSQTELIMRKESEKLLEEKNKKLTEIAFLQSHQVRRPVATLLGLVSILKLDTPGDPINIEMIPKIEIVTKELDAVIREIINKTADIESLFTNTDEHE